MIDWDKWLKFSWVVIWLGESLLVVVRAHFLPDVSRELMDAFFGLTALILLTTFKFKK